jgi:putative transposase
MQWFTTTHVRRYHRHYQSSGHLWQGRYKSFPVLDDDQFLTVARYVEGNPVRAGLVDTATDWIWSSHRERCGLEGNGSLAPMPGPLPANWTTFVDTPLTGQELAKVKRNIERQTRQGDWLLH